MRTILIPLLVLLGAISIACGRAGTLPRDSTAFTPGAPIPSFTLTEASAAETLYVESGDKLEIRLTESGGPFQWRRLDTTDIEVAEPGYAVLESHEGRVQRVFRFSTRRIGLIELVFGLVNLENNETQPEPLTFVIFVK